VVLVGKQCSVTIGVVLGVGNIMRNVIIRSLTATTVIGAVIFGSVAAAAAANPAPTGSPTTQAAGVCPLGTFLEPMTGVCMPF
jgi:hypothetical protein